MDEQRSVSRVPIIGDEGYREFVEHAAADGHLTEGELAELLELHRAAVLSRAGEDVPDLLPAGVATSADDGVNTGLKGAEEPGSNGDAAWAWLDEEPEIAEEGMSTREIGDVLGVNHDTVAGDRKALVGNPTEDEDKAASEGELEDGLVGNPTEHGAEDEPEIVAGEPEIVEPDEPAIATGETRDPGRASRIVTVGSSSTPGQRYRSPSSTTSSTTGPRSLSRRPGGAGRRWTP